MKQRILVVDDDPQYRDLLKTWLESEGHEAILAETLEEGFVGIATEPLPDVVLLDIHLGNKSGLTLVHWARKQKASRAYADRRCDRIRFLQGVEEHRGSWL